MKRDFREKRASALMMSLTCLTLLSIMGICFVRIASLEMNVAGNYVEMVNVRMLANAGLEYASIRLNLDFTTNPVGESAIGADWRYFCPESSGVEDHIGAGAPLTEIWQTSDGRYPSYYTGTPLSIGGVQRKVSGTLADNLHAYTLKIFDTSSQINLNSQMDAADPKDQNSPTHPTSNTGSSMARLLNNLSKAIVSKSSYPRDSTNGPLRGLGDQIMARRRTLGGFRSKLDILGITDGTKTIERDDLVAVWDYISVHPSPAAMEGKSFYKNLASTTPGDENSLVADYRCPVNLNTASWPVLVALFAELSVSGVSIGFNPASGSDDARKLADRLCRRRARKTFTGWDDFYQFLDMQKTTTTNSDYPNANEIGAFYGDSDADKKIAILKANCNPNVSLRKYNPDEPAYQSMNKADLIHYTLEGSFFPNGYFEITSMGQVFRNDGDVFASASFYMVKKIFDVVYQSSQKDFEKNAKDRYGAENGNDFGNYLPQRQDPDNASPYGLHGFTYFKNTQNVPAADVENASDDVAGHVQPVCVYDRDGSPTNQYTLFLTYPTDTTSSGSADKDSNYLFKNDFLGNHTSEATEFAKAYKANKGWSTTPEGTKSSNCLVADGVVCRDTGTLRYASLSAASPSADGNFPALLGGSHPSYNMSANKGSLMFWFKLGTDFLPSSTWHTVFFSTTKTDFAGKGTVGIQRTVQMRVSGPYTNFGDDENPVIDTNVNAAMPLLRTLEVQVRYKLFCYDESGNPKNPKNAPFEWSNVPCTYVDYATRLTLNPWGSGKKVNEGHPCNANHNKGVHVGEWYHLAIRWQDGTQMDGFTTGENRTKDIPILVSGNFYKIVTDETPMRDEIFHSGPIWDHGHIDHMTNYYILPSTGRPLGDLITFVVDIDNPYDDTSDPDAAYLSRSSFPGDTYFGAIDPGKKGENYFYLGYVDGTAPKITLDDVRISKSTDFSDLKPSRYPRPESGTLQYGRFKGRISLPLDAEFMTAYATLRNPIRQSTGGSGGGEEEEEGEDEGHLTAGPYTMSNADWKALFIKLVGSPNLVPGGQDSNWQALWNTDFKTWLSTSNAIVDIEFKDGVKKISKIELKDGSGNTRIYFSAPGSLQIKDAEGATITDKSAGTPDTAAGEGSYLINTSGKSFGEYLIEWNRAAGFPDPVISTPTGTLFNRPNSDFSGTHTSTTGLNYYDYEIRFEILSSDREDDPIYLSSFAEDITVFYKTAQSPYEEYMDLSVLGL